ncbi:MAG: HD-GYP domain-containing protein, partial [Campylobacterales bacterium]
IILEMVLADSTAFQSLLQVSSHDNYTFSHSVDVMIYAVGLGKRLGFEPERLRKLAIGAILHDIGKSRIDTAIINKKGKLSEGEFRRMMEHSELGGQMLMLLDEQDPEIYATVVHHHERYNGEGYPMGLRGEEIPLFAQIVGISDVFSALSTKRSYKDAFKTFEALRVMKEEMSGHFEPGLLKEFVQLMGRGI